MTDDTIIAKEHIAGVEYVPNIRLGELDEPYRSALRSLMGITKQMDPQAFEGLPAFVHEMNTQDNLATASPILIELQQLERVYTNEYNYDESGVAKDVLGVDECEDVGIDPEETLYWVERWVGKAWFFTWSGYKNHLEQNGHNYSKDIRPYVYYGGYRNRDMQNVSKWIKQMAAVLELGKTVESKPVSAVPGGVLSQLAEAPPVFIEA